MYHNNYSIKIQKKFKKIKKKFFFKHRKRRTLSD